ncbi:hypothetical protein WJX75_005791 [Coccomyxa subellipsoidea]|uniref:Uncharacterized protein n=1 Tax=Coccomyxa subellipsoidea TaxID=248742 RepID=A0ABR2Z3W7_9CHLO
MDALLEPFHNYFKCAKEIQEDKRQEGQDVIWLLVSDSEDIRVAAAQKYPNLILTNTKKGLVQHTVAISMYH